MIDRKIISKNKLPDLCNKIASNNSRILIPVRDEKDRIIFREVTTCTDIIDDYIQTTLSAKETVFPQYEEILKFKLVDKDIQIVEKIKEPIPTVVIGCRPCDARSFATLNAVFLEDSEDSIYKNRLDKTTLISISCSKSDHYCFCTSTGGGPGDTAGSDILLTQINNSDYLAEIITEKGKAIVALSPDFFTDAVLEKKETHLADVKLKFDIKDIREKIDKNFESEIWKLQSLRCLGCGACAYVCPACSCYDLQDEKTRTAGSRVRCWDNCGFSNFTLHTSGHNPREVQSMRWRQRIMHKFSYQPDRLNVSGCVGCGRCSRSCPVDMNILEHLTMIMEEN